MMLNDHEFAFQGNVLFCDGVSLEDVAARCGTPSYVYSKRAIENRYRAYDDSLQHIPHRICYAVKANSNLAVLQVLSRLGAGFDIVSGGELFRVLAAGAPADRVVFSGVGKTADEVRYALQQGIHSFNCESEGELQLISDIVSQLGKQASVALRVNPDVSAITHPYISTGLRDHKFGIDISVAESLYARAMSLPGLIADGLSCHIGSQLLDIDPVIEAAGKVLALVERLRAAAVPIRHVDFGGGLGIAYRSSEKPAEVPDLTTRLAALCARHELSLMLEPGRSIVGEAGVLLTRVLFVKQNGAKTFVVVDAAMNDLIRPSLYQAHHEITPVRTQCADETIIADVVGPVCETGDFFARGRELAAVKPGDLLAIRTTGAYGFVLSSNYNSRPRACEAIVDGTVLHIARERETWADLIRGENLIPSQ
jgi:diaminopimelate decarboxylase